MFNQTKLSKAQLTQLSRAQISSGLFKSRILEVDNRLVELGAVAYNMRLPETRVLPFIVHPDEIIEGVVYGRYHKIAKDEVGRGMMVATNKRVMLIDKKPFFLQFDEITYRVISAVTHSRVGPVGTIVVHTRMGDVCIRTFNQNCAQMFVEAIEGGIFKSNIDGAVYDYA